MQSCRECSRSWGPTPDGVLTIEASLADEEHSDLKKAIGKPDIRIFLEGDTAKNGRSLPYTMVLPGSDTRMAYYQDNSDYHPRYYLTNAWPKRVAYFYQSTGSPTAGVAPVESISMNYTEIKP